MAPCARRHAYGNGALANGNWFFDAPFAACRQCRIPQPWRTFHEHTTRGRSGRQHRASSIPADLPGSPFAQALRQPILLGLFLPIQAGGWSASTLERTTDWRWEYNRDLVLKAEALGFDLVFALSQWLPKGGYGGVFDGNALDSFQTTAALTSITRRILLISTIHVLYGPLHPLHLAKWGATLDHISGGRWGINVVTGHRKSSTAPSARNRSSTTGATNWPRNSSTCCNGCGARTNRCPSAAARHGNCRMPMSRRATRAAGQRHRLGRGHRLRGAPFGRGLHHQPGRVGLRQRDRGPARPCRTREGGGAASAGACARCSIPW